jgi:hypothetical protein
MQRMPVELHDSYSRGRGFDSRRPDFDQLDRDVAQRIEREFRQTLSLHVSMRLHVTNARGTTWIMRLRVRIPLL